MELKPVFSDFLPYSMLSLLQNNTGKQILHHSDRHQQIVTLT